MKAEEGPTIKIMSKILILLFIALLAGCFKPPPSRPVTLPPLAEAAKSQAKPCDFPFEPELWGNSQKWKYGCYCGKGHPNIPLEGKSKEELMVAYYKAAPKDDIDALCQIHDVCWLEFTDGDGLCNKKQNSHFAFYCPLGRLF